jgi:hypothetical protein
LNALHKTNRKKRGSISGNLFEKVPMSDQGDCKYRSAHQRGYGAGDEESSKKETYHKENRYRGSSAHLESDRGVDNLEFDLSSYGFALMKSTPKIG